MEKVREQIEETLQFVYNSGFERAKRNLPIDKIKSLFVERESKILIKDIQSHYLSKVPKKKISMEDLPTDNTKFASEICLSSDYKNGYNQAIDDIHRAIKGE